MTSAWHTLFCSYKAQADQSAANLLVALLEQLVQPRPDIADGELLGVLTYSGSMTLTNVFLVMPPANSKQQIAETTTAGQCTPSKGKYIALWNLTHFITITLSANPFSP